jgi:hypothetical protein
VLEASGRVGVQAGATVRELGVRYLQHQTSVDVAAQASALALDPQAVGAAHVVGEGRGGELAHVGLVAGEVQWTPQAEHEASSALERQEVVVPDRLVADICSREAPIFNPLVARDRSHSCFGHAFGKCTQMIPRAPAAGARSPFEGR